MSSADEAAGWLAAQREGWAAGTRFAFAVTDMEGVASWSATSC